MHQESTRNAHFAANALVANVGVSVSSIQIRFYLSALYRIRFGFAASSPRRLILSASYS